MIPHKVRDSLPKYAITYDFQVKPGEWKYGLRCIDVHAANRDAAIRSFRYAWMSMMSGIGLADVEESCESDIKVRKVELQDVSV
jgi:hypothetical protein